MCFVGFALFLGGTKEKLCGNSNILSYLKFWNVVKKVVLWHVFYVVWVLKRINRINLIVCFPLFGSKNSLCLFLALWPYLFFADALVYAYAKKLCVAGS